MPKPSELSILVVEDEQLLRDALVFDFKRKGFRTLVAASGEDASAVLGATRVDLVISDVRMPKGDGVSLLKSIKEKHPSVPVVMFVTGFMDLPLEDAYSIGADAVFSKPFDRKALLEAVMRALTAKEKAWKPIENDGDPGAAAPAISVRGRALRLGRGGMLFATDQALASPDCRISFQAESESSGLEHGIEGKGIVRWIRPAAANGVTRHCGVEFTELADPCRKHVIEHIERARLSAYIPNF